MKCHLCGKEDIKDVGIFLEPICADCMILHGDSMLEQFYEQAICNNVNSEYENGTNALSNSAFSEEAFEKYIERVKNNNRGYSPDVIFRSKV